MKGKVTRTCLFIAVLIILRQGIAIAGNIDLFHDQSVLIEINDIDPAALFYIDSPLALNAEKEVRQLIKESKKTSNQ